jgi:hypothetical protein
MTKVRFQADADLNIIIVLGTLRAEPTIDFQTAVAAGLRGRPDPEVLAIAASEGRILLTHDHRTMPGHFGEFISGGPSPGVFVIPQNVPVIEAIDELVMIWAASEAEEWTNRICYLPL